MHQVLQLKQLLIIIVLCLIFAINESCFMTVLFKGFAQQKVFFMVFCKWRSIVFGGLEIRPTPLIPACKCLAILQGVGVQGVVCWVWGVILPGASHGLLVAGCEMLSLILEFQTCQLGLCFAHLVTIHRHKNVFSRFVALYFAN